MMMPGMSNVHRSVLREQRVYLQDNFILSGVFMDRMIVMGTLEAYMKEEIDCERTPSDKRSKFLEILPRRGPDAFNNFLQALRETGQQHVADHLSKECQKKIDMIE